MARKEGQPRRANKIRTERWLGNHHSEESRRIMSQKASGENNVAFGTHWIHNLELRISKRVNSDKVKEYLFSGWNKGRKLKFGSIV